MRDVDLEELTVKTTSSKGRLVQAMHRRAADGQGMVLGHGECRPPLSLYFLTHGCEVFRACG